jgi:hypothetical protein
VLFLFYTSIADCILHVSFSFVSSSQFPFTGKTVVVSGETEMKDDIVGDEELKLDQVIAEAPSVDIVESLDDVGEQQKEKKKKEKLDQVIAEARSVDVVEGVDDVGEQQKKKKKKMMINDQMVDVVLEKKEEEQQAEVAAAAAACGERVPPPQPAAAAVVVEDDLEEDRQRPNEPYIKWRIRLQLNMQRRRREMLEPSPERGKPQQWPPTHPASLRMCIVEPQNRSLAPAAKVQNHRSLAPAAS